MSDAAVSIYFSLSIDTTDLGFFTGCQGLGMDMQVEQHEEGGGGMVVYQMMGRVKYTNLTITRPIGPDTAKTMSWLRTIVAQPQASTAQLAALDPAGNPVFAWTLLGVVPAKWTGPSFDVSSPQPATESLELAYTAINIGPAA
ncbi:MAG: phage tail protein [Acidimicrobiaceae bacterium]|nr:phage tail protein [Acidimicrobiaceae bacterium]